MKYSEAQLISKYTELKDDGQLYYQDQPVDTIPSTTWENWMNSEGDIEKKTFFDMMLQRALKTKKHP